MATELREILTCLEAQPLSEALSQLKSFAIAQNLSNLAAWTGNELYGYSSDDYPQYRIVNLKYFDKSGQTIPELSQEYGSWPLSSGIHKLETHLKHGLTLKLPPQVLDFLAQKSRSEVFGGYVEPQQIKQIVESVRNEALLKLQKTESSSDLA